MEQYHGTTILSVRRGNRVAMGGDGQVTLGNIVVKATAKKVRRLYQGRILAGFAGGTADAFTLFERFEAKLEKHQGNLVRSAVELAKDWRSDRALRRLEAMLSVADLRIVADHHRQRRCAGAGARYCRHRFGRYLRPERSPRLARKYGFATARHRHQVAGNCRRPVHLHQPQLHAGDAGMTTMTPKEIVSELDKHIVGQNNAKKAVAIALRNRWRRSQVAEPLRQEIAPKNILMIGPTGVGKTEIARRLARLANAPFIKVEATKFTEVGYVGRDVETIIRDLVEMAIKSGRERAMKAMRARAEDAAEERVLDALLPPARSPGFFAENSEASTTESTTRQKFRKKLREGELDDKEIDIRSRRAEHAGPKSSRRRAWRN